MVNAIEGRLQYLQRRRRQLLAHLEVVEGEILELLERPHQQIDQLGHRRGAGGDGHEGQHHDQAPFTSAQG